MNYFGGLSIAFVVLKLTGHIDWSWWQVTAPVWIPWVSVLLTKFIVAILDQMKKK